MCVYIGTQSIGMLLILVDFSFQNSTRRLGYTINRANVKCVCIESKRKPSLLNSEQIDNFRLYQSCFSVHSASMQAGRARAVYLFIL